MPMNKREQELVLAAMNGNTNCFEELYTLYYEKIYALALTMTKNSADAEDVLQATFISAWKNLAALENPAAFNTWLQRITVNRCNSLLRRRRYDLSTDDEGEDGDVMQLESDLMLPEQYAERDDLSHRLQKMISELSDVQRETVTLYYYSEMTVEEIAEIMGCAEGTVKSRLYLARRALKTEIEEQERKTGERFYGVALLPFGTIFVKQVNGTMISKSAAMHVFQRIASTVFGVPPVMPQSAPPASVPASSPVGHAAAGVARHGARYAAAGAAKLSVPLWAKIAIGVLAVVLAAAGGVVAWGVFRNPAGETTDASSATAAVDQAATQQASEIPTQAPTEAPTVVDVDPSSMPQSLDAFLTEFNYGGTRYGDAILEYDCLNLGAAYDVLASAIVGNPSCVDDDIYPGEATQKLWESDADPLGKFNNRGGTIIFDEAKLLWIMENIFHHSAETSRDLLDAALEADDDMYEYERDGKMYVYKMQLGIGKPGYYMTYRQVRFDGERYYFIYDVTSGYGRDPDGVGMITNTYYAEMAEKEIDGKTYWTLYRHTATIPELPVVTGAGQSEREQETKASAAADWSTVYEQYITENKNAIPNGSGSFEINEHSVLALHDFDLDGTPELLIGNVFVRGVWYSVFKIQDGIVTYVSEGLGRQNFYSDDSAHHGLFNIDFYGGIQTVGYFGFSDGEWVSQDVVTLAYKNGSLHSEIKDQALYQVYLDCTQENASGSVIRDPVNSLKASSWDDVSSNGWDSFIQPYGY